MGIDYCYKYNIMVGPARSQISVSVGKYHKEGVVRCNSDDAAR